MEPSRAHQRCPACGDLGRPCVCQRVEVAARKRMGLAMLIVMSSDPQEAIRQLQGLAEEARTASEARLAAP